MDLRKLTAEAIGTFWLTFGGCGSAVIAAGFPHVGIGLLGVSFAFGLTLLTMAYAIGHVLPRSLVQSSGPRCFTSLPAALRIST